MKKLKVGDVIKIKKEHIGIIKGYHEKDLSMKMTLQNISDISKDNIEKMFNFASNAYPELKDKSYNINHKENTITILKGE